MLTIVDVILIVVLVVLALLVLAAVYVIERAHANRVSVLGEMQALVKVGILQEQHIVDYVESKAHLVFAQAESTLQHGEARLMEAKLAAAAAEAGQAAAVADAAAAAVELVPVAAVPVVGAVGAVGAASAAS